MLERRKTLRRKMVLPVKVTFDEATHLAHTIDITGNGARLGGFRTALQIGTIVSLQRGPYKAKFRIMWVQQLAPNELQAGVECLEPRETFWGVDLSAREREVAKDVNALMRLLSSSSKAGA